MVANYDVADPIPIIDRDRKAGEPTSNKSLPLIITRERPLDSHLLM
jgi:hypothetical protein